MFSPSTMVQVCMVTECSFLVRSSSFCPSDLVSPTAFTFFATVDVSTEQPASIITLSPMLPPPRAHPTLIIYINNSNIINTTAIIRRVLNTNSKN